MCFHFFILAEEIKHVQYTPQIAAYDFMLSCGAVGEKIGRIKLLQSVHEQIKEIWRNIRAFYPCKNVWVFVLLKKNLSEWIIEFVITSKIVIEFHCVCNKIEMIVATFFLHSTMSDRNEWYYKSHDLRKL